MLLVCLRARRRVSNQMDRSHCKKHRNLLAPAQIIFFFFFFFFYFFFYYSFCSHLEHRAPVKPFVSLKFLNFRESVGLLGRGISSSQCRYLTQTQNKETDIHGLNGIRTQDPSVRAREDISCLRPRGNCDPPFITYINTNFEL
jgi:hypothetical protein